MGKDCVAILLQRSIKFGSFHGKRIEPRLGRVNERRRYKPLPSERLAARKKGAGQPAINRSKQAAMAIKTAVVFLIGLAFGFLYISEAQQPKKVPRIGYVSSGDPSTEPRLEAFRRELRDLGYIEAEKHLS